MDERQAAPIAELLRRGTTEAAPGRGTRKSAQVALGRFFFADAALGRVRGHELHRGVGRRAASSADVTSKTSTPPLVASAQTASWCQKRLIDGVERVPPARLVLVRYEPGRRRALYVSESNALGVDGPEGFVELEPYDFVAASVLVGPSWEKRSAGRSPACAPHCCRFRSAW